jgi:hypothetical protein
MLLNEDYPHSVPTRAWLRWRENWLYFLIDIERGVFATAHMSLQPTFGIARYACNLIIDGERFSFTDEVPCPADLAQSRSVILGPLHVAFVKPQQCFEIHFDGPQHELTMRLEATLPLFDYAACMDTNPDDYSLSESTSLGFGHFRHQNQTMRGTGTLRFKDGSAPRNLAGVGYRDHSWGMRDDTVTNEHIWAWAAFSGMTLHVTRVITRLRPTLWVSEGYVGTPEGNLAVNRCQAIYDGHSQDDLPATVRLEATDPYGRGLAVMCNLAGAYARNRFLSQRPGTRAYLMKHTFCPAIREDTRESGIAMVEIGRIQQTMDAGLLSQGR